jgi:hypothetical protein
MQGAKNRIGVELAGSQKGMIFFQCPGMIKPLDVATLARCRIIPFLVLEMYDFTIPGGKHPLRMG